MIEIEVKVTVEARWRPRENSFERLYSETENQQIAVPFRKSHPSEFLAAVKEAVAAGIREFTDRAMSPS